MDEKQARSLGEYLSEVLRNDSLTQELLEHFKMYEEMRDRILMGGIDDLRTYLDSGSGIEIQEGYVVFTPYSDMKDILFGDITLTPPHFDKYPTLCKWRLSLPRSQEAPQMQEPATTVPPAPAIDGVKA